MTTILNPSRVSASRRVGAPHRFGRAPAAALILIGLVAWLPASGAVVELGRKGQTASSAGSTIRVFLLSGNTFQDQVHQPGDLAQVILGRIHDDIVAHPSFGATIVNDLSDPNRNAIDIMRTGLIREGESIEPYRVEVFENDPGIRGAGIQYPASDARDRVIYRAPDAVNGDGNVRLDLTLVAGGLHSVVVPTAGRSAAQVGADLRTALAADGFVVTEIGGSNFTVTRSNDRFLRILWSHTDSGVTVSGVGAEPAEPPPPEPVGQGEPGGIPVLSEWGTVLLVLLLGGAAILVLVHRHGAGSV